MERKSKSLWDTKIVTRAAWDSFVKLDPRTLMKNPVMFVVEIGAALLTYTLVRDVVRHQPGFAFGLQITLWLWFTVVFANFAEAMAEGRGKAQADTLRKSRTETLARRVKADGTIEEISGSKLRSGDVVMVTAGEFIPGDGEVIEGVASVDESAITGESAPVIRESGGDRSAVTGGTRVLSDEIKVRITSNPGETFLDRMIKMVEGASRQKTPNEIALNILLCGLTIIFLLAVAALQPMAIYSGAPQSPFVSVVLAGLPDPDDDWRAALGHRHCGHGPRHSAQRHGHVGTRRRSRGRCGYAAARQNWHDHSGQSASNRIDPGARCVGRGTSRRRATFVPCR